MAAHMISQAYGGQKPAFQSTPDAIAATRQAMNERFEQIAVMDETSPRQVWSDLVRAALEEREMPRVRGLLLGAPAMLGETDAAALNERIKVAAPAGDEAVIQAALTYLPDDLQDEYRRRTQPLDVDVPGFGSGFGPADGNSARRPKPTSPRTPGMRMTSRASRPIVWATCASIRWRQWAGPTTTIQTYRLSSCRASA